MDKIHELTSKLYSEGVEKGKEEAAKIIADAKATREQIIEEAKNEARQIRTVATKEAEETRKNTESELKLYASQAAEALKSEITNLLTDKIAAENVKLAMDSKTFMQELIVKLVKNWAGQEALTIGVEKSAELEQYLQQHAKEILDKGLRVETVNGVKSGFVVSPEDKSYRVKFGENEFIEYFREFLRPQIQKLLF